MKTVRYEMLYRHKRPDGGAGWAATEHVDLSVTQMLTRIGATIVDWPQATHTMSLPAEYGLDRHGTVLVSTPVDGEPMVTAWVQVEHPTRDANECATEARVGLLTWNGYVSRGQAPKSDGERRSETTGRMVPTWSAGVYEPWLEGRIARRAGVE